MRKLVCGLAFFMAVTSTFLQVAVFAQETEQQLSLYSDLYVDAGKRTDFETFHLDRNWRLAAANVSSGFMSAVSDQGVYRFLTNGLPNMAAVDTRAAQMRQLAPASPAMRPLGEAIERLESSIRRQRLELSYVPANPRISIGEARFFRELSFYFKGGGGAAQDATEIMQRFRALYEANDISMGYTVNSRVLGTGANLRVIFFARDAVDFYTAYGEAVQRMGQEFQTLATELIALCNRTEFTNWTIRGDLSYQPAN